LNTEEINKANTTYWIFEFTKQRRRFAGDKKVVHYERIFFYASFLWPACTSVLLSVYGKSLTVPIGSQVARVKTHKQLSIMVTNTAEKQSEQCL
jgi:hypothetical protein